MPLAPGRGRFFLPLNRGKRSVVLDLKTEDGRGQNSALIATADVVLHNYPPERAAAFGLEAEVLLERHPALVIGVVSSFGPTGPLAGNPAYDLVAQAHAGLLTSHAGPGDTVPVRAGGIPLADLTAGHLLASSVLAALVAARTNGGRGSVVDVSLLAAALAIQVQDLVWLDGEPGETAARAATPADLRLRADEIQSGLATNPYYRCYETSDSYVAVACLNVAQRRSFLALFALDDPTVEAPDVVPNDAETLAAKQRLTSEVERLIAAESADVWLARLAEAGVPASPVLMRESVLADEQIAASGLLREVEQPGLGRVRMLGAEPAPLFGADTNAVLGELG
jgi:crotonobetainyl-CoA:carnitine CoA-transferase CaiB-like acyl-CoA transferase